MFDSYLDSKKEEMIHTLCEVIKFPSVSERGNNPFHPFGEACSNALNFVLETANSLGFKTKNLNNYCGYIEFGEGSELVGIIGHLDVVPADNSWSYSPFAPTVTETKIYGRGAIDDKGPVIASLYAMKAVMDMVKVKKRVRLILGLNEEKDWEGIAYYKQHEELPTIGFSPDADFPCIYAEKGILTVYLRQHCSNSSIKITNIDCHQNAINVVPKYCQVVLEISSILDIDAILNQLLFLIQNNNYSMEAYQTDSNHITITSHGISAHAAHPELGTNAISALLVVLHDIFNTCHEPFTLLDVFYEYINTQLHGESLDINYPDESGELTLNVGNFSFYEDDIQIGMNLRIPVHTQLEVVQTKFQNIANAYDTIHVFFSGKKEALFLSKSHPLVQILCSIFERKTGILSEPIAIGGATYARAFDNCISFGANMPNHVDMCHQADEYMEIDNLLLSSKIYAEAIYELAK